MAQPRRQFIKQAVTGLAAISTLPIVRLTIEKSLYTFVNVGFGDTCVLNLDGKYVLIDVYKSPDSGEDFTRYIESSTIELLILTHRHYDHCFGIEELLNREIHVKEAWESRFAGYERPEVYTKVEDWEIRDSKESDKLFTKLEKQGTKIVRPVSDHKYGKSVNSYSFHVLNPPSTINDNLQHSTHDGCMVIKMVNPKNENEILFCGDASHKTLDRILNEEDIENTRILCSSHHGALDSLHREFVKRVNPEYTIISSKPGTWGEIPEKESLDFYASHSRKGILKTFDGTIQLKN